MLRALAESSIESDVILGTSIGAINGAMFAADPTVEGVRRLGRLWADANIAGVSAGALLRRVTTLARTGTHLQSLEEARRRLADAFPVERVEELKVPFQCVAASIERAAEHWFADGVLADVVLASCAVPGILPPVPIGDEHFIDGGIVNSIPVARAVVLGARTIYVPQVGRLERPLQPPRRPWEVGLVAFEVARRGNPGADVIFAAHSGLGLAAFPREIWHETPLGETFHTKMWLSSAAEHPLEPEAQVAWIYDWWKRLDEWIEEQGTEPQSAQPGASPDCPDTPR
jgi:NTE family protein